MSFYKRAPLIVHITINNEVIDSYIKCCGRWHDAGTYDAKTKTGGADGSIRNQKELNHKANDGIKVAVDFCGECFFWLS